MKPIFLILYKEMFFKHIYASIQVKQKGDWKEEIKVKLFIYLLNRVDPHWNKDFNRIITTLICLIQF
jgi:hypothetical protein